MGSGVKTFTRIIHNLQNMYHQSVPKIRRKLDGLTEDERNLIMLADNMQKLHEDAGKYLDELKNDRLKRPELGYIVPTRIQINLRLRTNIKPSRKLLSALKQNFTELEKIIIRMADTRAQVRYILTNYTHGGHNNPKSTTSYQSPFNRHSNIFKSVEHHKNEAQFARKQ